MKKIIRAGHSKVHKVLTAKMLLCCCSFTKEFEFYLSHSTGIILSVIYCYTLVYSVETEQVGWHFRLLAF